VARLLPLPARNLALQWRDQVRLRRVPSASCEVDNLALLDPARLTSALSAEPAMGEWPAVESELAGLAITAQAGGVNPGDRRALYALIRTFRPARVLEIGTHIGASTAHLAVALRANAADSGAPVDLTTVDITDVNDPVSRPWAAFGSTYAPVEMMRRLGVSDGVRFVVRPSLDFLRESTGSYDFIFLDGDHQAATVYRELPAALRRLSPGGLILLHDYFPGGRPLWPGDPVIPGPWLGGERLRREGAPLRILPLGDLPWPTKLGRSVTSLAIVTRAA